ncbi:hypothetical protein TNCV_50311 [Trichonephila clavipes]|nr:hypothetical protein TNCV_50311 [Trichonephila clavipes]
MGGAWASTPQRCSAGCLVYRQCVLEGCGSEIQYPPQTMITGAGPVWRCITPQFSSPPHGVSKTKLPDHRDIAGRSGIRQ